MSNGPDVLCSWSPDNGVRYMMKTSAVFIYLFYRRSSTTPYALREKISLVTLGGEVTVAIYAGG